MATMKDVAKKANVGIATVSRVINNSGFVSQETREIVERVINELGYVPNELARSFQKKKTNVIAVIVPEIDQHFSITLVTEIEKYLRSNGYIMMLGSSNRDNNLEQEYFDKLRSQHVAGIIVTAPLSDNFKNSNFPLVSFDRSLGNDIPYVHTQNYEGSVYLTELLIKNDCKTISYVDFSPDKDSLSRKRKTAFIDVCEKNKITYNYHNRNRSEETTLQYLERIFDEIVKSDGVFFACDSLAKVFVTLCFKHNIKIPNDLQIVSYDAIKSNDNFYPILSSVGHNFELIAKTLVDIIFKQMNNNEYEINNELPYIIRDGETTK